MLPSELSEIVIAIGALGTASFALVDTSKAFWGGVSNIGFGRIRTAVRQFLPETGAATETSPARLLNVLYGHWINGSPLADQKAIAKSLVKLALTESTAPRFAQVTEVDATVLTQIARKMKSGEDLDPKQEANVLGRFDLALTALLDEGYQRADQRYRNSARLAAAVVAVLLAVAGGWAIGGDPDYFKSAIMWQCFLAGLLAMPLAPIAKDLASALSAGVKVAETIRR